MQNQRNKTLVPSPKEGEESAWHTLAAERSPGAYFIL